MYDFIWMKRMLCGCCKGERERERSSFRILQILNYRYRPKLSNIMAEITFAPATVASSKVVFKTWLGEHLLDKMEPDDVEQSWNSRQFQEDTLNIALLL